MIIQISHNSLIFMNKQIFHNSLILMIMQVSHTILIAVRMPVGPLKDKNICSFM